MMTTTTTLISILRRGKGHRPPLDRATVVSKPCPTGSNESGFIYSGRPSWWPFLPIIIIKDNQ
jgi:hypothetical protein